MADQQGILRAVAKMCTQLAKGVTPHDHPENALGVLFETSPKLSIKTG